MGNHFPHQYCAGRFRTRKGRRWAQQIRTSSHRKIGVASCKEIARCVSLIFPPLRLDHWVRRLFNMIDQAAGLETMPGYPPYNIERTRENAYRISVAVAGFAATDLSIETKENTLTIHGSREREGGSETAKPEVLYQGIAARSFERRFQLADTSR